MPAKRALFAICSMLFAACAAADQSVYSDELDNGWVNWSWNTTLNFSNPSPVHAGQFSVSASQAGYGGIYLHHGAFSTADYLSLQFWINGGAGGQKLQVQATLNGAAQSAVQVVPSAGSWSLVNIPLADLGVANAANFDGFWVQDTTGISQPAFYLDDVSLVESAPPDPVSLSVDFTKALQKVDTRMFGVNTAVWDSAFDTSTTLNYLKAAGICYMRFPGGSLSDDYHWATNTTDNNTWTWATSFDMFSQIATGLKSQVVITTNYGTGTPQEAAGWVQYANVTKQLGFKNWELGNECYGSWETDSHAVPHDPYTYATVGSQYMAQMKAVDPTIKVGAVVVTGEDSYANNGNHPATNPRTGATHNGWVPVMLSTFKSLGTYPDFVVYHFYAQAPGSESDDALLHSSGNWQGDIANIRQMLNDYLGTSVAQKIQIIVTENNSVYSNPGKQSVSLVNALYLADSFGNAIQTEMHGFCWWDLRNGQQSTGNNESPSLYGWRLYGDYGIVSPANDRYPSYFALRILKYFSRGNDVVYQATTNYDNLTVYAVKHRLGTVSIMVINKRPDTMLNGQFALTGFTPQANGTVYSYGIPQDNAEKNHSGSPDISLGSITNAGASFSYAFPPYSITVFTLTPAT